MLSSKNSSSKDPLLFEIRLNSVEDDIILLKGNPEEASSVFLSGTVVFSVQQPIHIKNMSLRLNGKICMNVPMKNSNQKGLATKYNKVQRRFYLHNWDDFNIKNYFANLYDNYGKTTISSESGVTPEQRKANESLLKRKRAKSTNSILSFGNSSNLSSSNYHTLVRGNYEFPFNAILPGSLTESIEGLPNAAITYTLEAIIERPKLADLICRRHLRVIRTLRPDALELTETISVDNTWPEKVDYSISIPAKAVPIGSSTAIDIVISPLLKGLRLGPVKIHLVENTQLCSTFGISNLGERLVNKVKIKDPYGHLAKLRRRKHAPVIPDGSEEYDSDELEFQDNWTINTAIDIPSNLLKCVQDCTVLNSVKVRHKLKFVICLINPDGHVSELRASLPIQLFISPFVPIKTKTPEAIERDIKQYGSYSNLLQKPTINIGTSSGNTSPILLQDSSMTHDDDDVVNENEDVIFTRSRSAVELCSMANTNTEFNQSVNGMLVPPDYGSHVYDRVWNGRMSPVDVVSQSTVPVGLGLNNANSGTSTPIGLGSDINLDQLNSDLQGLTMERAGSTETHLNHSYFNDLERIPPSPSLTPAFDHISRANSFSKLASSTSLRNDFQSKDLSRVPSYDKALRSEVLGDDLPPAYPEGSTIEHPEPFKLERPQFTHQKSNSSLTVPKRRYSNNNLSRSNNSSSSSLNLLPNNGSGYSQSPLQSNYQKNSTVNKKFAFGMTPVDQNNEEQASPVLMQRSSSKGNFSPSQRSGSFASLVEIFTKKK